MDFSQVKLDVPVSIDFEDKALVYRAAEGSAAVRLGFDGAGKLVPQDVASGDAPNLSPDQAKQPDWMAVRVALAATIAEASDYLTSGKTDEQKEVLLRVLKLWNALAKLKPAEAIKVALERGLEVLMRATLGSKFNDNGLNRKNFDFKGDDLKFLDVNVETILFKDKPAVKLTCGDSYVIVGKGDRENTAKKLEDRGADGESDEALNMKAMFAVLHRQMVAYVNEDKPDEDLEVVIKEGVETFNEMKRDDPEKAREMLDCILDGSGAMQVVPIKKEDAERVKKLVEAHDRGDLSNDAFMEAMEEFLPEKLRREKAKA